MFMAKYLNDDNITAMGDSIEEVWQDLQFGFELTDAEFDDLEWFKVEPITIKRELKYVIE